MESSQVRYAAQEISAAKSARARGSYLRVSFKNTRETAQAVKGMKLERALKFLDNVQSKAECVPMRRYAGGEGRTAQGELIFYSILREVFRIGGLRGLRKRWVYKTWNCWRKMMIKTNE